MIVELFAGCGGASEGIRRALPDTPAVGIEWETTACRTRRAASHTTIRADVATYPTEPFIGKVSGMWASPPCPDFSAAGRRRGVAGKSGSLIFEVLRWALALRPMWLACEQVPEALSWWKQFGRQLEDEAGYSTWAGILCAADYEAPLPWVSMAEGLGWGAAGPSAYRRTQGAGMVARHGARRDRPADEPAPTVTSKTRSDTLRVRATATMKERRRESDAPAPAPALAFGHNASGWEWVVNTRQRSLKGGGRTVDYKRSVERPSPTLTAQIGGFWQWEQPATTVCGDPRIGARRHHDHGQQLTGAITTDELRAGDAGDADGTEPIKLTVEEALLLQGFPADYPVRGSRTRQFEQIGNACPPAMVEAIVRALMTPAGGH